MKKSIAFFDFDGTITRKDSFLEWIRFAKGNRSFLLGFALLSPWLVAMKLGLLSNTAAKQIVIRYFFGGSPAGEFQRLCERFARERIPAILREKGMRRIMEYLQEGIPVVVVSASLRLYLEPWCKENQLHCMATELESIEGIITGRILGKNCHGQEKVARIHKEFNLGEFEDIYTYGDTKGDLPFLALGNHPNYKPFHD